MVLIFSDDQKRISVRVSEGRHDLEKGCLSVSSPLGKAILGAEEGDEVDYSVRQRRIAIPGKPFGGDSLRQKLY